MQCHEDVLVEFFRQGVGAGQGLEAQQVDYWNAMSSDVHNMYTENEEAHDSRDAQENGEMSENGDFTKNEEDTEEPENSIPVGPQIKRNPDDKLLTDVRISRSKDPKCEVGRGLLAHAEQDREPDEGMWAFPERIKISPRFYLDVADRFNDLYNDLLRRNLRGKIRQLSMPKFQRSEKNEIADHADDIMRMELPDPDNLFNILMDVIYSYLEQRP